MAVMLLTVIYHSSPAHFKIYQGAGNVYVTGLSQESSFAFDITLINNFHSEPDQYVH